MFAYTHTARKQTHVHTMNSFIIHVNSTYHWWCVFRPLTKQMIMLCTIWPQIGVHGLKSGDIDNIFRGPSVVARQSTPPHHAQTTQTEQLEKVQSQQRIPKMFACEVTISMYSMQPTSF